MAGIFYGISVGPGDPEYMTLKAVRILKECPVIAAPRTDGISSAALDIAKGAVDLSQKKIVYLDFLMIRDKVRLAERHRELTDTVAAYLDKGQDVAMVNLGDCSLYASYSYLRDALEERGYQTQAIAGVTSFSACAALVGVSLTQARLPLHVIPGDYPALEEELKAPGTKVIMKSGKGIDRVQKALESADKQENLWVIENCGMESERITRSIDDAAGAYFTTILVGAEHTVKGKTDEGEKSL